MKQRAEKRRAMLGQANLALCFQIPLQASLHGILKSPSSFCYANRPALSLSAEIVGRNSGLRLASKRGCVVKKHLQARLRVSFPQQIQHSRSESTRIFYLFIRVHPSHPWLKCVISS